MTVTQYVERVRAALADLPPQVRDELLEDLPEHLAEVAAETGEPLEERLGPPEAYAAELRSTVDPASDGHPSAGARLFAALTEVRDRARVADARIGRLIGYDTASEFVRQLRPGWWLLRGYLVAMLVAYLLNRDGSPIGLLPRAGNLGFFPLGLALLVLAVAGSVWLGRRSDRLSLTPRLLLILGTAYLASAAMIGFAQVDRAARDTSSFYPVYVTDDRYADIHDVYVYDRDGRLLEDVMLVDQSGSPILLGDPDWCARPATSDPARYPRCPALAPGVRHPWPRPTVSPAPVLSDPATASPSPSVSATG